MAIELYFSNQLEPLADKFAALLAEDDMARANVFDRPRVVVPNANLAKWLQLFLARKNRICMHMAFEYLEVGLWNMLASLDGAGHPPDMLDIDRIEILLLFALGRLDAENETFRPLTRYLMAADGRPGPDYAARLWQLSERLAHLFKEYEFHRMDMIRRWQEGKRPEDPMERCQRELYLVLQTLGHRLADQSGTALLSMPAYAEQVLSLGPQPGETALDPGRIHLFGLSQISDFHLTLLGRLQACYDLAVYALNPSREFWEDIQTPAERRWIDRKSVDSLAIREEEEAYGGLLQPEDNALLAAWGKPGREGVRLLCRLTNYDFNVCFADIDPAAGVLQRIQHDILTRSSDADAPRLPQDRSLQIAACPSIYREVETVTSNIVYLLEQTDDLQLTDIAILVPDIAAYKPVFDAVFSRRPERLAYNLVDACAEIESIYGRAVTALLNLAAGRFSRSEVFDLILNPCFMHRWQIDADDARIWADWTRELNIFHTYDREDRIARGYPDSERYTWKQGLQRLRLGRIMNAESADPADLFPHFQGLEPFEDLNTSDVDLVEKFCLAVEGLHLAAAQLTAPTSGAARWKQVLFEACDRLFDIPEDLMGEAAVRQSLMEAFDRLELLDRLGDAAGGPAPPLDVALVAEFVRAGLGAIPGGRGDYLTGGVTISALQPMRPLPFRVVYVLGMQEGGFPGRAELSSLDLRLRRRRIGDVSRPERNCYLFLEMMLSVRERLVVSYVSRDLQKDRRLQPCSVVNQLRRYAEQAVLPPGRAFRIAEIPLSGSSGRYIDPGAVNDWSDVLVNASLADRVALVRDQNLLEAFEQTASKRDLERIDALRPDFSWAEAPESPEEESEQQISAGQLKHFLLDPVRHMTRRHLEIYDEQETIEDLALSEDEPFFSEFPLDYRLKLDPLKYWLDLRLAPADGGGGIMSAEAVYDMVYERCRRNSQTPEGAFGRIDHRQLREQLGLTAAVLEPLVDRMQGAARLYRALLIGDEAPDDLALAGGRPIQRFAPPTLTVSSRSRRREPRDYAVALHGRLPWVWQDQEDRWHALILTGSAKKPKRPDKYVLEPLLAYLLCLAGETSGPWIGPHGLTLHVVYRDVTREWSYPCQPRKALRYLRDLAAEYLDRTLSAWLPFEVATGLPIRPHEMTAEQIDEPLRRAYREQLLEAYLESAEAIHQLARASIAPDACDRAARRFTIFFDCETGG